MRPFSLTTRLTTFFSLSSAAVLLGLGALIAISMDRHFAHEDFAVLEEKAGLVRGIAQVADPAAMPQRLGAALQNHPGLVALVRTEQGAVLHATEGFEFDAAVSAARALPAGVTEFTWRQDGAEYRGLRTMAGKPGSELLVIVGLATEIHAHFMHGFLHSLVLYVVLSALVSGVFGWWAARSGLAPLRTMAARARAVTAQKLDQRMPVEAVPPEMADLASTLNAMLARLQDDFRRLSEFSSDLAHELRTPLTNLLTQTHVVLAQPREAGKYREILASNEEELQRLSRMVSDMLYLAKMEHGITLPQAEAIAVQDEVNALFEFYEALAEDKAVALRLSGQGRIVGDRLMLRRALSNLLSNALRYTPGKGAIDVDIACDEVSVTIGVENDGKEIPAELIPSLFDRFFRADKSRARPDSESAGLGLSITRAIMVAHGGHIAAGSAAGRTRFTLVFPVRHAPDASLAPDARGQ
ncbi:heavy metal sensor histidine kinase [Pigmentiphaga sp. GD03639]|uniref:heavy metal sensor histidine kinase n=1 Tax=Pigmentiphaga sp. GD03639 TaxID=2975354 RepID=UPI002447A4C1|nr:heavy metal sensor histidine kinase [Pigmentiphaga sp. GD03639]MDH2237910.1 heavy metal sensor histidine kinase [Pigmentiphaga sp. GD03639]